MSKHDFYVVDGCVDFIPVKESTLTQNGVEVTIVGNAQKQRVLVDKVYQMSKIFEPQKVVVPKFVADWVDNSREYRFDFDEWFDWDNQPLKVYDWLNSENKRQAELNALALVTLIVNGANAVEIEQEKLYTVEIPNPNSAGGKLVLFKQQSSGRLILDMLNPNINKPKYLHLTESEIKRDFEWAFRWAKEVDVE